jgi:hypothetical protein
MRQANRSALWLALANPYFVPVCFITYLSLRLGLILAVPIDQYSDNLWYYNRGISIGSGQGYSEGGVPTAYWPPGWPRFLGPLFWLFGPSALVGQIANLTLSGIIFFPLMPWLAMYAAWAITQWRGKPVPVLGSAQEIVTLCNPG